MCAPQEGRSLGGRAGIKELADRLSRGLQDARPPSLRAVAGFLAQDVRESRGWLGLLLVHLEVARVLAVVVVDVVVVVVVVFVVFVVFLVSSPGHGLLLLLGEQLGGLWLGPSLPAVGGQGGRTAAAGRRRPPAGSHPGPSRAAGGSVAQQLGQSVAATAAPCSTPAQAS